MLIQLILATAMVITTVLVQERLPNVAPASAELKKYHSNGSGTFIFQSAHLWRVGRLRRNCAHDRGHASHASKTKQARTVPSSAP